MTRKHDNQPQEKLNQAKSSGPEFMIQRIYLKDISYEAPSTPNVFESEWAPKVDLSLDTSHHKINETIYEVVVKITATVNLADKTAFLIEVHQAGIFTLKSFPETQIEPMLESFCPNILFPYAREVISETVTRGGFPPLYIAPINFDALYQQKHEKKN
jgi:preprotein translocase subunit SecB